MIKEGFEEHLNYILDCIPDDNLKSEDEVILTYKWRKLLKNRNSNVN